MEQFDEWEDWLREYTEKFIDFSPNLIAAILLLVIGL